MRVLQYRTDAEVIKKSTSWCAPVLLAYTDSVCNCGREYVQACYIVVAQIQDAFSAHSTEGTSVVNTVDR